MNESTDMKLEPIITSLIETDLYKLNMWQVFLHQFDTVKFLFANSPVNYRVDVNPYKTRVYKNRAGETILALYAEDRDGGEWRPISEMKPDHIMLIDNNPPEFKWKGASDSPMA